MFTEKRASEADRLFFTLFLATMVHLAILFGVGFGRSEQAPIQQSLEITLAQHSSEEAPEEADFLAQANQQGSGDLDEKAMLSTTELADFSDNVIREVQPVTSVTPTNVTPEVTKIITSQAPSTEQKPEESKEHSEEEKQALHTEQMLLRSLEIASLEAQLREKRQSFAKRPRKRQLTAVSTKAARDAEYLDAWRTKIETLGNINYPKLNIQNLFGDLRLLVSVNSNGTIHSIKVLKSSGYKRLDDAAIKVVRLAAPFEPFPDEIRKDTDILEIIRTWRFEKGHYLSSS